MDCILLHILSLAFIHLPLFVPKKLDVFVGKIISSGCLVLLYCFILRTLPGTPFPASKGSVFSPAQLTAFSLL